MDDLAETRKRLVRAITHPPNPGFEPTKYQAEKMINDYLDALGRHVTDRMSRRGYTANAASEAGDIIFDESDTSLTVDPDEPTLLAHDTED